jgi:F420-dependent oxidoreductase-like protein
VGVVIGTFGMSDPLAGVLAEVARADADGLDSAWLTQGLGLDAIVTLAQAAPGTSRIDLGVAVVPYQLHHPLALAQAARTAALAAQGRFVLGVGVSHRPTVEDVFLRSFASPVRELEQYLDTLVPALAGDGAISVPAPGPVPLLLAALGPRMLRVAATRAAGTVTWLTGARTLRDHVVPTLRAAADAAGRPEPRVAAALPIAVTDDVAGARARADDRLGYTARMPSYRAMLDREGAAVPADIALVGDESQVGAQLDELAAVGVTDFLAIELRFADDDGTRTRALLRSRARARG